MSTRAPRPATVPADRLAHPRIRQALRTTRLLVGCYAALSVLTLGAVVLLRDHPGTVTDAVWVRTVIVVVTSLLMVSFAARTARGHGRSYLRLRVASAVMVVVIAAVVVLPGAFPAWLKIEQGACGVLLAGVVLFANGARVRAVFAGR
ncbi:hypothetical protein [Streptomyces rimosus]|uniref:hypothetical protein n=1 Tax=Streptomyces rimosus TaxID=1927 RepID=UPI0037B9D071